MTILKLEIELDYIDDEGNISDVIRSEIIASVQNKVTAKAVQEIIGSTDNDFKKRALDALNDEMNSRITDFFNQKRTITDSIGRTVNEDVTIDDLLSDRLTTALTRGKDSADGMRGYIDRALDHKVTQMHRKIDDSVAEATKSAEKHLEQMVQDAIKTQVADKLTSLIMENSSTLALKS